MRPRLPNGERRPTTIKPKRNLLTVEFGDDVWGTRERIREVSRETGRTISSIVREVLRKHFASR